MKQTNSNGLRYVVGCLSAGVAFLVATFSSVAEPPPQIFLYSACIQAGSCVKNTDALCNVCPFPVVPMVCYAKDNWGCRLTPDFNAIGPNQSTGYHAWYSDVFVTACRAGDAHCIAMLDMVAQRSVTCGNSRWCSTGRGIHPDKFLKDASASFGGLLAVQP